MKTQIRNVIATVSLLVLLVGCATVSPGTDPLVVRAEQTTKIAFEVIDQFLAWEYNNRATLDKEVTQVANEIRLAAPDAIRMLRAVTKAYKAQRDPETKTQLVAAISKVEALQNKAMQILAKNYE